MKLIGLLADVSRALDDDLIGARDMIGSIVKKNFNL
jgi:hypothetical protein